MLLIVNSIIGAGIFGLPSRIFALSGIYSLLAFAACAAVVMVFILCFAEVSSRFDKTGGPYLYAYSGIGPFAGFLAGWLLLLGRIFNYATLINLLVIYLSFLNPFFNDPVARIITILLFTAFFAYINHIGVKESTKVNNLLTIAKLLPLTAFIVFGLFNLMPGSFDNTIPFDGSSFSKSVLLLTFAFGGFESVLVNTGEIKEPKRNLPFALITATVIVTVFYCLIQFVSIGTHPSLAGSEKPLAEAATNFMGTAGGNLIAIGAVISITGTLNALSLAGSRIPFALSNERQLPGVFSYINPNTKTPTLSLLLFILITAMVSLFWTFFTALTIGAIIRVLLFFMVCLSMISLRKKEKGNQNYFRLRYGYFFATAGILFSAWLLSASRWTEIRDVAICIVIGLVFYWIFEVFKKKEVVKF